MHRFLQLTGLTALALACSSCGKQESGWRSYKEVTRQPERGHNHDHSHDQARAPASMPMPADMPGGGGAAPAGSLAWKTPEGWTESAGSGMRLASFSIGSGSDTGLCTIVMLGGNAGGEEANVVRWIGQIGLEVPAEDALRSFLERQEKITSAGGYKGIAVDLSELDPTKPQSMLAAMLDINGSTAFIKLTGPVALLKQEKPRFIEICASVTKP